MITTTPIQYEAAKKVLALTTGPNDLRDLESLRDAAHAHLCDAIGNARRAQRRYGNRSPEHRRLRKIADEARKAWTLTCEAVMAVKGIT